MKGTKYYDKEAVLHRYGICNSPLDSNSFSVGMYNTKQKII